MALDHLTTAELFDLARDAVGTSTINTMLKLVGSRRQVERAARDLFFAAVRDKLAGG